MQVVSYSPYSLAFTFILHHSGLVAQEELAFAQLAAPLTYFSISPEFFPVHHLLYSPPYIIHCTMLCLTCPRTFTYMHTY